MGKRRTKKELAKQRKLQKERAMVNRKREENMFYRIASFSMDALIHIVKGIVVFVLFLFIVGSKVVNIISALALLLLVMNIFYSAFNDDVKGMSVSIIGVIVLASVLFFIKRIEKN